MTRKNIGLYRSKRKDNFEWVVGFYAEFASVPFIGVIDEHGTMQWFEVWPAYVGEATGLSDKNGQTIFEDDIISTEYGTFANTGRGVVKFFNGMWTCFYGDGDRYDELFDVCTEREVVGNIHDHKELLIEEDKDD